MSTKATHEGTISAQLQAVLDHQAAVKAATAVIEKAQELITQNVGVAERVLQQCESADQHTAAIEAHRAAVAIGDITQEEASALEKQSLELLDQATKNRAVADELIAELNITRNGLQRRLDDERGKLESLAVRGREVLQEFLLAEAEAVCAGYVEAGNKVKESFIRLVSLNELLRRHVQFNGNLLGYSGDDILLPKLNLPQCDGFGHPNIRFGSVWFGGRKIAPPLGFDEKEALSEETGRLRACGVELP